MKLTELGEHMREYDESRGPECQAYQDFLSECVGRFNLLPTENRASETEVPKDMAKYWMDVVNEMIEDYDMGGNRGG